MIKKITIIFLLLKAMDLTAAENKTLLNRGFLTGLYERKYSGEKQTLEKFCRKLTEKFKKLRWKGDPCGKVKWKTQGYSRKGHPLIYWVYGTGPKTTLLISGVHPDELTPIPMGFRFANYVLSNPLKINPETDRVIIIPLANPDGFLTRLPTRVNNRGIDINRNFQTADWHKKAISSWIHRRGKSHRHFPGLMPNSEPETLLQTEIIARFQPDKILSIHAPLGFLDYDGPGDRVKKPTTSFIKQAKGYAKEIAKISRNYRVVDYSFYPGSLGNYAGNERHIPTVTLELRTSKPEKAEEYWRLFLPGMLKSIEYPFRRFTKKSAFYNNNQTSTKKTRKW
mgnify:CR=1 FL=1